MKATFPLHILTLSFLLTLTAMQSSCQQQKQETAEPLQLFEVYDVHGSEAKARLTVNGQEIFTTDAYIGKNGLGKQREGDKKTPLGTLHIRGAFGILPNPGTKITYIDVRPSTFSCSDEGPYYNLVIDTARLHHTCDGEDMFNIVPEYNYGIMTDYNKECISPLGNSIFIHCKGDKPYTGGCIAIDEERMIDLLTHCDHSLVVNVKE